MKHTDIRAAVLDALEQHEHGATLFDGRPAVFDEADFPAIAVYLTGAEYTGEALDSDTWQAELHIEVFLPAQVPDSELDSWMESRIYPAMSAIPALSGLITTMVTQGYEYRRDDDMALSGQPVNGDREEIQVRQVRRGRKATGESGEIPV
ncbi:phage minor tail U family protein [Escherichia coli]|uniref:phage minor tail U family protein n=1 Tax=Escherichia coli TaxID=562 RepID=UPI00202DE497|nr:phage minor tail U family protein [Escherichia coli]